MQTTQLLDRIEQLIDKKSIDADIFFVDARLHPGNKVEVFIDSDSGLTISRCAEISRYLQLHIDSEQLIKSSYQLEVSSPGIDKPLKLMRQYRKNVGRQVLVEMLDGAKKTGRLLFASEEKLTIEEITKKNKIKVKEQTEIPFIQVKSTRVKVTF